MGVKDDLPPPPPPLHKEDKEDSLYKNIKIQRVIKQMKLICHPTEVKVFQVHVRGLEECHRRFGPEPKVAKVASRGRVPAPLKRHIAVAAAENSGSVIASARPGF